MKAKILRMFDEVPLQTLTTREVVRMVCADSPAYQRAMKRKRASEGVSEPAIRTLPTRYVPDSSVNGRPTVNTAVRALMPTLAEIIQAERATRALNES